MERERDAANEACDRIQQKWAVDYGVKCAQFTEATAALLALRAAFEEAVTTLNLILAEPHGCPMCDSGRLRNLNKQHWDNCGFAHAQTLIAGIADQDGPRHD